MKIHFASLFLLIAFSCKANEPAATGETHGRLLLKSGFENGVSVSSDKLRMTGSDVAGYSWDQAPDWIKSSGFVYLVKPDKNLADYMDSFLEKTTGPQGKETTVLCMKNKADDPDQPADSRNEFSFFSKEKPDDFKEGYVRYWMKLQDNLNELFSFEEEAPWYMIMEWKEPDSGIRKSKEECETCCNADKGGTNNYRININLKKDKNSDQLYWAIRGEHPQPCRVTEWIYADKTTGVPLGEWFLVEAYLKKDAVDGRVYFAVNGQVVLDTDVKRPEGFTGRTQHKDNPLPLHFWSPLKNYHAMSWNRKGPVSQWYDDFELWSSFPPEHPEAKN
jgi:hypothetical protein